MLYGEPIPTTDADAYPPFRLDQGGADPGSVTAPLLPPQPTGPPVMGPSSPAPAPADR